MASTAGSVTTTTTTKECEDQDSGQDRQEHPPQPLTVTRWCRDQRLTKRTQVGASWNHVEPAGIDCLKPLVGTLALGYMWQVWLDSPHVAGDRLDPSRSICMTFSGRDLGIANHDATDTTYPPTWPAQ